MSTLQEGDYMSKVDRYINNWCVRCRHVLKFDYSECCHDERRNRCVDAHILQACVNGNWFECEEDEA